MPNNSSKRKKTTADQADVGTTRRTASRKSQRHGGTSDMPEPVQLSPEEVRRMASVQEEQHLDDDFQTPGTSLVTPPERSNVAGSMQTSTAKASSNATGNRLSTGLTGVDSVTNSEAVVVACKYTKAQEKEEKAKKNCYDVRKYVKLRLFPVLKFISGKKPLEYGNWALDIVLDWLKIKGYEQRMKKWEEVQKLVNEAVNTRRNDCTSAMKKKFIGKIFCIIKLETF